MNDSVSVSVTDLRYSKLCHLHIYLNFSFEKKCMYVLIPFTLHRCVVRESVVHSVGIHC